MKKNFKEKDYFIFLNKERVRLTMLVTTNYYMEYKLNNCIDLRTLNLNTWRLMLLVTTKL